MQTMAIDQYGTTFHALGKHPRKELLKRLGYCKAVPMYCDKLDGTTVKTGWIIGGHWLSVFQVVPLELPVR
mgnify:CR=1 FL=1